MKKKILVCILLVIICAVIIVIFLNKNGNFEVEENVQGIIENKNENVQNVVEKEENQISSESESIEKITIDAEKIYKKYLNISIYRNSNIGPMPNLLVELGLESEENIDKILNNNLPLEVSTYIKSNTLYEDFKNEMLKYVTEDLFERDYSDYKNMNGYVGFCPCAAGIPPVELKSLNFISSKDENYYFEAVLIDIEVYEHFLNPEEGENISEEECFYTCEVNFVKENGNLVVADVK